MKLMKMHPVGAEVFHAERHEANSRFSQLCEHTHKKDSIIT